MAHTGLEEFPEPTFDYGPKFVKSGSEEKVERKNDVFESASDSSLKYEVVLNVNVKEEIFEPKVVRNETKSSKQQVKQPRSPIKYAEMYRSKSRSKGPRGNYRNWNNFKSHQLGSNFVMNHKACYIFW